jgi:CDP-glucose 4,6-dehydratase
MAIKKSSMEGLEISLNNSFWVDKKVFLTGHTGFKGSWLSLWLNQLGAKVTGFSLKPPTNPSLFNLLNGEKLVDSLIGDVRDRKLLFSALEQSKPEIIIHMAAQPLVRDSYLNPVETYETNVMGTVNLLDSIRNLRGVKAVVNVTTDKCYENREWLWGYRESEAMGGYDPYSNSKGCSELVTTSFRNSFFNPIYFNKHGVAIASARAGNVIGGGDWAADRLIPDCINSIFNNKKILIRNPSAIRPWQHVFEPLSGYLLLAEKLYLNGPAFAEGWNFGPDDSDAKPVSWIVETLCKKWGKNEAFEIDNGDHPHEATYLKLDCSKAKNMLEWKPRWNITKALEMIIEWYTCWSENGNIQEICIKQINEYVATQKD